MSNYHRIFLASASPRRRQLLADAGIRFSIFENEVDENIDCPNVDEAVLKLSELKADSACDKLTSLYENGDFTVIAADTLVCLDNKKLGKPASKNEAASMLRMLSGRTHNVYTGVCILNVVAGQLQSRTTFFEKTDVSMIELSDEAVEAYIESGEPMDKAGAYAIQGKGAFLVSSISGNYHNVVGLPISRLLTELKKLNIPHNSHSCRAVVFDLDGTILDTIHSLTYSGNKTLERFGKAPIDVEKYKYFVGDGASKLVERFLQHSDLPVEQHYENAMNIYMEIFSENMDYRVLIYEGLYEVLTALKQKGVKIAVFTNKPDKVARGMLRKFFGEGFFDEIQGDADGKKLKPDPYAVCNWAEKWSIDRQDILYLGDTNTDMQTGLAAGAYTVGVSWGFRKRDELLKNGAMDIIDDPAQILNYV